MDLRLFANSMNRNLIHVVDSAKWAKQMDGRVSDKPSPNQAQIIDFTSFLADRTVPQKEFDEKAATAASSKPKNYLETGIDSLASLVITDQEVRDEIDHYGSNFLTTAALFARGNVGIVGTALMYGLANTGPETPSAADQVKDFMLGAAKGETIKGLYAVLGKSGQFSATKGMMMGLASRCADDIFQRDLLTNPTNVLARLDAERHNTSALAYDALVWGLGEGVFQGANKMSGGALVRSQFGAGMFMGATFGALNGGGAEIIRQQALNQDQPVDWTKVAMRGLLQGGLDAAAAGFGIGISDPAFRARVSESLKSKAAKVSGAAALTMVLASPLQGDGIAPAVSRADVAGAAAPAMARAEQVDSHVKVTSSDGKVLTLAAVGAGAIAINRAVGAPVPEIESHGNTTISVMAPLLVGDPTNPDGEASKAAWTEFDRQLVEAKKLGVHSVSSDVWWGLIEPKEGQYRWQYYDKLADHITKSGLKWTPILSFHQCGGNVGDNVYVPVPEWVWSKMATKLGSERAAQYVSERGNASKEFVSAWATDQVLGDYANVMRAFQNRFASKAPNIAEINVSLGPAGELRYPSYNSHDMNPPNPGGFPGYPTRGSLQSYSETARESFRQWALSKYGGIEGLRTAWSIPNLTAENINPPSNAGDFFALEDYKKLQYGRDFFDWYSDSLINHGQKVLTTALDVFGSKQSAFRGIDIGAKIPGVHWHLGDLKPDGGVVFDGRLAELTAGLIRTSGNDWNADSEGRGYRPILSMFKQLQSEKSPGGSRVVPAMTALELQDGQDPQMNAHALPHTLAKWVGQEAQRQNMELKGENALSFTLHDPAAWDRMRSLLILPDQQGYYSGLTLLRMGDIVNDPLARAKLSEIINAVNSVKPKAPDSSKPAA